MALSVYGSDYFASGFFASNYYRPISETNTGGGGGPPGTRSWSRTKPRTNPLEAVYRDQRDLLELYQLALMSGMLD